MKVSLNWLKELVDYQLSADDLANKLSLSSIGVKQQTEDYLELDLTYNRGDLLSLRGVAREVAAITRSKVNFKEPESYVWLGKDLPELEIVGCIVKGAPVYCVAKIENLKVEGSNETWVKKLSNSGIRSINNVADITNLIMLEYGQPLHAFDASQAEGIHVDEAIKGWKFITLDGKGRLLEDEDLLIRNRRQVIGIAGIMGGKDSEVTKDTTSIVLEAAIFDPVSIRKTATRLGLHSEASKRFQHGLTTKRLLQALDAAIRMYESLGGKLTAISFIDQRELKDNPLNGRTSEQMKKTILIDDPRLKIYLTREKINSLLGVDIPADQIELSLKNLGFELEGKDGKWQVTVPYFRLDINIEEDLIEEVARMYGYEKITGTKLIDEKIPQLDQTLPQAIYDLKLKLREAGLTEVQTYSFYSTAVLEALGLATEDKKGLIRIANPISSETEYLRRDLWPNLLEVVGKNIRAGFKDIRVFEIGKVYCRDKNGHPEETDRLSIALMNGSDNPLGELYQLTQTLKLPIKSIKLNGHLFHPKRQMDGMAEVHLRVLNKLGIEKRVAVLELIIFPHRDS